MRIKDIWLRKVIYHHLRSDGLSHENANETLSTYDHLVLHEIIQTLDRKRLTKSEISNESYSQGFMDAMKEIEKLTEDIK